MSQKYSKHKYLTMLLALAITSLMPVVARANLIINGGFEEPVMSAGPYVHLNGTELTGWTSFSTYRGTVLFDTSYGFGLVSEGNQAVQIEVGGDYISQSFATTIGNSYLLSFDLSNFSEGASVDVSVGSFHSTFFSTSMYNYTHEFVSFIADSPTTTLAFINSSAPGAWGNYPHIDNVDVSLASPPAPVPEPEAYAMLLAGLGLLSFTARRRKQSA